MEKIDYINGVKVCLEGDSYYEKFFRAISIVFKNFPNPFKILIALKKELIDD